MIEMLNPTHFWHHQIESVMSEPVIGVKINLLISLTLINYVSIGVIDIWNKG